MKERGWERSKIKQHTQNNRRKNLRRERHSNALYIFKNRWMGVEKLDCLRYGICERSRMYHSKFYILQFAKKYFVFDIWFFFYIFCRCFLAAITFSFFRICLSILVYPLGFFRFFISWCCASLISFLKSKLRGHHNTIFFSPN